MSEIRRVVPPLFDKKMDLAIIAFLLFVIFFLVVVSGDPLEYKTLKITVTLLTGVAFKLFVIVFEIYYPSFKEKPYSISSCVFVLLVVIICAPMQFILTWDEGDIFKEHIRKHTLQSAYSFFVIVLTIAIFRKRHDKKRSR